jgi:hypothetical protein
LKKNLCRGSGAEAVGKDGFSILLKKTCAEGPVQRPSAKMVFYFFKKFLCRVLLATTLGKAGNTGAGKIFPRVAKCSCQKHLAKGRLLTASLGKEASFFFCFPH